MAALSVTTTASFSPIPTSLSSSFPSHRPSRLRYRRQRRRLPKLSSPSSNGHGSEVAAEVEEENDESMSIGALQQFVNLNLGVWNGSFHQFDARGNLLQNISTRLSATSYGERDLLSLIQTLYVKQAPSKTFISDKDDDEPEWVEYKIKETNIFTVDKYQQIGYFPKERAFSLRYQTCGMLETVLRTGVLGEDDAGEESPRGLKLPSRYPSVVCENCLYSMEEKSRARAFHILDPKGIPEMVLIFLEKFGEGASPVSSLDSSHNVDVTDRLKSLLGCWQGHSITKRSGVYGATIAEAETVSSLELNDNGQLILDISSTASGGNTTTNVRWIGQLSNNTINFDGGFQTTILPGGMYVGCPSDVSRNVAQWQSFHLEFCWMESPNKRQRLVRTYDHQGLAVSSTYFYETKV